MSHNHVSQNTITFGTSNNNNNNKLLKRIKTK